jgi:hypothetical protein
VNTLGYGIRTGQSNGTNRDAKQSLAGQSGLIATECLDSPGYPDL